MSDLAHCQRCRRQAPRGLYDPTVSPDDPSFDEPGFDEWEPVVDGTGDLVALVCGGCMTGAELAELAEDMGATGRALSECRWCGKPAPETTATHDLEDLGWVIRGDHFGVACPSCSKEVA